jgi:hypothetical protein
MVEQDLSDLSEPLCPRPIALQFAGHAKLSDRLGSSSYETADCHVMCFRRGAAWCVGDDVHVVAFAHRVDSRLRETHLRPECRDDKLFSARLLHGLDDAGVLPRVDEAAVDGLLVRKNRLNLLENLTAALRVDCRENRRNSVRFCGLGQSCDVVDHHCGLVTIYVRQLRRLVIDQEKDAILGCKKSVEADFRKRLHNLFIPPKLLLPMMLLAVILLGVFERRSDNVWMPNRS